MFLRSRLRFAAIRHLLLAATLACPLVARGQEADAGVDAEPAPPVPAKISAEADRRAEAMARVAAGYLAEEQSADQALEQYRRALNIDPANAPLAESVAAMYLQREDVPEALSVLKDALKLKPDSASLSLRIAGIYVVGLHKYDLAERYADQALRCAPDDIRPYQMLYSIHRATGNMDAAMDVLRRAGERKDGGAEFWAGLGDLEMRQMLADDKVRDPERSAQALEHYRRATDLGRQDPAILLRALQFFFASGNSEDAVSCARRLLVLQPDDVPAREKLALSLSALGRDDEAIKELEAIVAENPGSILAYRAHGDILAKRGDAKGAVSQFEKALALADEDPRSYLEIADLCVKADDLPRAAHWLGEARAKFTQLPDLPFLEGQLLAHMKRWREALNAFDLAAQLAERNQPAFLSPEFHFQHGAIAERAGEHDIAERHMLSCLAIDGENAPALNFLGYMWAERGVNLPQAEDHIRRALAKEPDNAAYLDSLGWVLYQQGRYHEALAQLERARAAAEQPDSAIEEHLGDTLEKLGRTADAVKAWERAASLEDASPAVAAKLQAARANRNPPAEAKAKP